jgi:hypothetical protein
MPLLALPTTDNLDLRRTSAAVSGSLASGKLTRKPCFVQTCCGADETLRQSRSAWLSEPKLALKLTYGSIWPKEARAESVVIADIEHHTAALDFLIRY